jgi:hypothetical protein
MCYQMQACIFSPHAEPVDIAWPTPPFKMDDSDINIPLISLAPIVHCLAEFADELSRIGVKRTGAAGPAENRLGSSPPRCRKRSARK